MIKEDYCSFELSKLLRLKGFEWECIACYTSDGEFRDIIHHTTREVEEQDWNNLSATYLKTIGLASWYGNVSAPTHQMAMKWLREAHKLSVEITSTESGRWMTCVYQLGSARQFFKAYVDICDTYEEAVEDAVKHSLENLI